MGFEPTVAINNDSFQDCSVRPLRHASVPDYFTRDWLALPPEAHPRSLSGWLLLGEDDSFEAGKHLGHTVIFNGCGHRGRGILYFFRGLAHRKRVAT